MAKKRWKDYQDYLQSKEWKEIKNDFDENYCIAGWADVCEITGEIFEDQSKLHYHHFKYPKDWADDSPENIIRIGDLLHRLIHGKYHPQDFEGIEFIHDPKEHDLQDRQKYMTYVKRMYNNFIEKASFAEAEHYHKEFYKSNKKNKSLENEIKKIKIVNEFLLNKLIEQKQSN